MFVILFALVAHTHSAAIPRYSAVDKSVPYLAAVHYGQLPRNGIYYEYIQPVAVLDHEIPRELERIGHHERSRREVSALPIPGPDGSTAGGVLSYDHANGHGASLGDTNIPGVGNQLTASGRLNLVDADKHRLDANAYHSRTFLNMGPTIQSTGGGLDYRYNDRHGTSMGISHTDLLDSTTYSGTGKLNLYQSPSRDTYFDLTSGLSKTTSPFLGSTDWQPSVGFNFRKEW